MRTKGTWAIVGLTRNEWRSAYDVSLFVRDRMGMEIIPVNLPGDDVHGEKGYRSLAEIPAEKHPIDVVDCFVNSQKVGPVIDQAIAVGRQSSVAAAGRVRRRRRGAREGRRAGRRRELLPCPRRVARGHLAGCRAPVQGLISCG